MKVYKIMYDEGFLKQALALPVEIQQHLEKTRLLLLDNPLHPSLRLHKLKGSLKNYWSVSVTMKYRIIFRLMPDGVVFFTSVGTHRMYSK